MLLDLLFKMQAIDWLISYYWEPQEKVIPNQNIQKENLEKKIKHRLQKVALCQKAKIAVRASNSSPKGKCELNFFYLYLVES